MKKSALFLFSLLSLSLNNVNYHLIASIPIDASVMTIDQFSNCYLISENQLIEYDSLGKMAANFSDKNLGTLSNIDAFNPLKLQLFYPDNGMIVTLDNKLAIVAKIKLHELDIQQPILICSSYNDAVWVYDQQDFKLKKIESTLQVSQISGNISQTIGYDIKPIFMVENNHWIYMNNPESGILVFDIYGSYYKTIPITGISFFQVMENQLLYFKDNVFRSYDFHTLEDKVINLPTLSKTMIYPRIEKNKFYTLERGLIEIFSY